MNFAASSIVTAANTTSQPIRLAFIDRTVPEYQTLIKSILPGTEVVILDPNRNGISQITEALANYQNIASLDIISHGAAGEVDFSSSQLNLSDISQYAEQLQTWQQALTPHADILLYGCDIASTEQGQYLLQQLAQLTGADVAASTDATGGTVVGGNWNLEYRTGNIEALGLFDASIATNYNHRLATLTVTSNLDDGSAGTLRSQIAAAAPGDTITFDTTGVFATAQTITLTNGQLGINKNLTIQGTGASNLTISGSNASRVLYITDNTINIDGLTITGGSAFRFGGAIYVTNGGTSLNLSNSTVSGSFAGIAGGGICSNNSAQVNLVNTTVSNNAASRGGGISNRSGGKVKLINSTISSNSALKGGGIYNPSGSSTEIDDSTISSNSATNGSGGGICSRDAVTVNTSNISGNSASNTGGGLYNTGSGLVKVDRSIISNNTASGGGGIANRITLELSNSTISSNSASIGGGIYNIYGEATIVNSTISGNFASEGGGGIANTAAATIDNNTISGNATGNQGGGIFNKAGIFTTGSAQASSNIVAGNTANTGSDFFNTGIFASDGNNLVGQNGSTGGFPANGSDIVLAGAIGTAIAPLADNGGFKAGAPNSQQPILTHAIAAGSPAIDKGITNGLATDERSTGFARTLGTATDIGAFESPFTLAITATPTSLPDLTISKTVSSQIVNGGQTVTFTLTVSNIGQTAASNITVSDALPSGLSFFTATATGGFSPPNGTDASGNLNFIGGSLAAGASATLTVVVTTPSNLSANGYTNTATVDPLNAIVESNENNNSASVSVGVIPVSAAPPIGEPLPNNQPIISLNPIPGGYVPGFFPDLPPSTFITPELGSTATGRAISGTDSSDVLTGGVGNDTIRGGRDDDTIYGYGGDNLLIGGRGNDVIFGGKGKDTLIGANADSRGKGEIDILIGKGGANLFILGDAQSAYYDDGDSKNLGTSDYALITDFNLSQDTIQLKAGLNYLIGASPAGLPSGAAIFIDNDGIPGLSANDELIGILQGVSDSNTNAITSRFQFV